MATIVKNIAKSDEKNTPFQRKEKEQSYGLTKPLSVKWEKDPIVGQYMEIVVAVSETRTPTEFVVSKLIGKSNIFPKTTWVINRRKDVPELIKGAADPMKDRMRTVQLEMERDALVSSGLIKPMGESYVLTEKASATLAGNDFNRYLDRTKAEYEKAKEAARKTHDETEGKKPFRQRKKFAFEKTFNDFMTKEERAVQAALSGIVKDPDLAKMIDEATKTSYETLIDGERQQTQFKLKRADWEYLSMAGIADEVSKTINSVFKGTYTEMKPDEAKKQLEEKVLRLEREAEAHRKEVSQVHDYYKSSNEIIASFESRITNDAKIIEDLREENEDLRASVDELTRMVDELSAYPGEEEEGVATATKGAGKG